MSELSSDFYSDNDEYGKRYEVTNGDVIKVDRGLYYHYGIYVAPGKIVHYTDGGGKKDFKGIVQETSIEEFLNGADDLIVCRFPESIDDIISISTISGGKICSEVRYIKDKDKEHYHLYSGDETVDRAYAQRNETGYHIIFHNCEHFAVWCKTNVEVSHQVSKFIKFCQNALTVIGAIGAVILAIGLAGGDRSRRDDDA